MIDPVKLEHFRNLVSLSAANGKIEEADLAFTHHEAEDIIERYLAGR